ncbi:MAG: IgGFc-binding protein [Labilithrix sp.]|nr:IgGFc-binding protein [Labilithrix sp.]MCW5836244.1 IgGFc-binding protein [Labilithrix sp.]
MRASFLGVVASTFVLGLTAVVACGSDRDGFDADGVDGGEDASSGFLPVDGGFGGDVEEPGLPVGETRDPVDCEEAKTSKSYVGCDYWPTITPNTVWSIFDYAVVVANTGSKDADVTITGPNGVNKQVDVPAGQLRKIFLPWVPTLKGADGDECGSSPELNDSAVESGGAYHLVSSTPVIVYQFNALQYKGEGGEGPDGGAKDWSTCPGTAVACQGLFGAAPIGCFSFTNDASLLLPSTAMTNNYRVTGYKGASQKPLFGAEYGVTPTVLSVTATQAGTSVTVSLAPTAKVVASVAGQTIPATAGGGTITLTLANAGDVAQFVTDKGKQFDFSGSLVQSDKPVQVIASTPCINIPSDRAACDHIEETVLPAETLGKRYVVAQPTGPKGQPVGQNVRFYGNQDGTKLTYSPSKPAKCPDGLNAGQVADCEVVNETFEVSGDKEFGVSTFLLGATTYNDPKGDPSQTNIAAVEQFRTRYVFLAPNDYPTLWADITATEDAEIELDGKPLTVAWNQVGSGPLGLYRVDLTKSGQDGAHTLTAKKPVGVQVIGFGDNTSFQYPAGLNLNIIAPPPPPPK